MSEHGVWKKPREFWIENYIESHSDKPHESAMYRYVHVIEYSAFEQLEKEKAELKDLFNLYAQYMKTANYHQMADRMLKDLSKLGGGND